MFAADHFGTPFRVMRFCLASSSLSMKLCFKFLAFKATKQQGLHYNQTKGMSIKKLVFLRGYPAEGYETMRGKYE
jgi:hypothetical protein